MIYINITDSELLVYKTILDADEPIAVIEIIERVKVLYGKEWRHSTVCAFISHLKEKGYVESHKKGVRYYYSSLIDKTAFLRTIKQEFLNFWFEGSLEEMLKCLEN